MTLAEVDREIERALTSRRGGSVDAVAHLLSSAADRSKLWIAIAGLRAARDGTRGRRLAVRVVTVVAVESAVIHAVVKRLFGRTRPAPTVPLRFGARRPPSSSFPSGHAASAASAAVLLGDGDPVWTAVLASVAVAVAWSRVQTGLHHPSDCAGGLAIGAGVGVFARFLLPVD